MQKGIRSQTWWENQIQVDIQENRDRLSDMGTGLQRTPDVENVTSKTQRTANCPAHSLIHDQNHSVSSCAREHTSREDPTLDSVETSSAAWVPKSSSTDGRISLLVQIHHHRHHHQDFPFRSPGSMSPRAVRDSATAHAVPGT